METVVGTTIALAVGFLLDLLLGDPNGWYHPVITIGKLIAKTERFLRSRIPKTPAGELFGGVCLAVFVPFLSAGAAWVLILAGRWIHPLLGIGIESVLCYYILATKSLKTESMKVAHALQREGLAAGRTAVSMIVGRDTQSLDSAGVVKAAVETVAENASDGVIAPMLYMAIGGPALGIFYKAINTMDSMVGYRNEKYLYFGQAAARLDDVANFIPARICACLMVAGACLGGFSGRNAWRTFRRDRRNHKSPNSAQTESVMAGALGVQLAGDAWYFGKKQNKPTIGDDLRPITAEDIAKANQLLYRTAVLGLGLCLALRGVALWGLLLWR